MQITTLIWDADGTLFDSYPPIYRSVEQAMASYGLSVQREELVQLCQVDMATCFSTLATRHQLEPEALIGRYQTFREQNPSDKQALFPELREACEWFVLHGGQHFIVTHRDRQSLLRLLGYNACTHWFSDIIAGDDDYPRKPDPTGLRALVQRNAIDVRTAMFVGDRELDIQTARNVSMLACQFGTALTNTAPDMRITRYARLIERLQAYSVSDNK